MRSWISIFLLLAVIACNKPETEEKVTLNTKVTFTLQDLDFSTRTWTTNNAYAQRSDSAIHLFATNEFGEQLSLLLFDTDTGKLGLNFADQSIAKFTRIKAGVDTVYSTKKSDKANGISSITKQDPNLSLLDGTFQVRTHYTDFNYVWILDGEFIDVPYFSVPLTQGELDILYPNDTTSHEGPDPLACPDSISPCITFYVENTPYVVTGNKITAEYREFDRLVLKVAYNGFDTLTIGVSPNSTFQDQQNYVLGKTLKSKAFIETFSSKYIASTGTAIFDFVTDSVIAGGFELSLKESSISATPITVSQGVIRRVPITHIPFNQDINNSFDVLIDGFNFKCDTAFSTLVDSTSINITAISSVCREAFEIIIPKDVIAIQYNIGNSIKVNHTNFYGVTNKANTGTVEIYNHDKVAKTIEGIINVETYDFSENRSVTLSSGVFKTAY